MINSCSCEEDEDHNFVPLFCLFFFFFFYSFEEIEALCGKVSGHKKAFEKCSRLPLCVDVSYPNGDACEGRNFVIEVISLMF